jgi:hypothetical protein
LDLFCFSLGWCQGFGYRAVNPVTVGEPHSSSPLDYNPLTEQKMASYFENFEFKRHNSTKSKKKVCTATGNRAGYYGTEELQISSQI